MAPYSPQQNGVVEWRNAMVVGAAQCMLKQKGLPGWFLGEAVLTTIYLLNWVPCKANEGRTLFELWYGRKSVVHHLKIFGSVVYVWNTWPNLRKLEDRGRSMIFVGYECGTKAYRAYDLATKKVTVTRDLVFNEAARWDWTADAAAIGSGDQGAGDFIIQYLVWLGSTATVEEAEVEPHTPQGVPTSSGVIGSSAVADVDYGEPVVGEENMDADHDGAPLRLQAVSDIIRAAPTPSLAERSLGAGSGDQLFMVNAEEPLSMA
jgi:hypothetical protein